MNIATIRTAICAVLEEGVKGLRTYEFEPPSVEPTDVGAAVVSPGDPFIDYPETIRAGICEIRFRVILLAATSSERSGQAKINALLSSGSEVAGSAVDALTADRTLDGTVESLIVRSATEAGMTNIGGVDFYKADLHIEIKARRV